MGRRSTVEGPLEVHGAWGDAKEKAATVPLEFEFGEARGAAPCRIRFSALTPSVDDLEACSSARSPTGWAPDRPVRVGEVFGPTEVMAVEESLLRVALALAARA